MESQPQGRQECLTSPSSQHLSPFWEWYSQAGRSSRRTPMCVQQRKGVDNSIPKRTPLSFSKQGKKKCGLVLVVQLKKLSALLCVFNISSSSFVITGMKRLSFLNQLCCFSWYKTRGLVAAAVWKLPVNWIPLLANGAPWNYIGCTLFRHPTDLDLCSFQSVSTDPEENKVRVRLVGLSTEGEFKGLYPEARTHTKDTMTQC